MKESYQAHIVIVCIAVVCVIGPPWAVLAATALGCAWGWCKRQG